MATTTTEQAQAQAQSQARREQGKTYLAAVRAYSEDLRAGRLEAMRGEVAKYIASPELQPGWWAAWRAGDTPYEGIYIRPATWPKGFAGRQANITPTECLSVNAAALAAWTEKGLNQAIFRHLDWWANRATPKAQLQPQAYTLTTTQGSHSVKLPPPQYRLLQTRADGQRAVIGAEQTVATTFLARVQREAPAWLPDAQIAVGKLANPVGPGTLAGAVKDAFTAKRFGAGSFVEGIIDRGKQRSGAGTQGGMTGPLAPQVQTPWLLYLGIAAAAGAVILLAGDKG